MNTRIERLLAECQEEIQTSKRLIKLSKESLLKSQELLQQAIAQRQPRATEMSSQPKGESGNLKEGDNPEPSV